MTEVITSANNPKIKKLIALQQKSSERRESGLFVVEGLRELQHCLDAGCEVDTVFYCPEIASHPSHPADGPLPFTSQRPQCPDSPETASHPSHPADGPLPFTSQRPQCPDSPETASHPSHPADGPLPFTWPWAAMVSGESEHRGTGSTRFFAVSKEVYSKIAYREGTEGLIAEVYCRKKELSDLTLKANPLIVVLESVEKPGNLGAVLRSADAAGVDAVIVCDPLTDLYNPNLIRASLGGIFTVPCVACTSDEAIRFLKSNEIRILTAQLQDSQWYYDTDMRKGTAIVIGTESTGLTQLWRDAADAHIKIPMLGSLDSLNASVSAAILMFEAVRQRNG